MPNSRRYHNRHLSDFLKELDITRCRSIGYLFYFTIGLKSPKSERTSPTLVGGYPPFSAQNYSANSNPMFVTIHFTLIFLF